MAQQPGPSRMHAMINHLPSNIRPYFVNTYNHIANLEDRIVAVLPQINQGKVDNPLQPASTPSNLVPPPVPFTVTQKNGLSFVNIGLPQTRTAGSPTLFGLLTQRGQNASLAPLYHKVQSAASESFDGSLEIQTYTLGVGVWTLPDANPQWRLQSSFDTISFNDFSAPRAAEIQP